MEGRGLKKVGVTTLIVGLVLGIIVPFAQFGGVFPVPWVLSVAVLPLLWGVIWAYFARREFWLLVLLAQWLSLSLVLWLVLGSGTDWAPQAVLGGVVLATLVLALWMIPVAIIAVLPGRR